MTLDKGVSNYTVGTVVFICAIPAATLNIWPRISQMLVEGISGNGIGIILLVAVSALVMAAVPFAMKKAENWGLWSFALAFGIGLAILNFSMAVGAIGKVRDHEADANRSAIARYRALEVRLSELQDLRKGLPAFRETTSEMVETGKAAVNLAIEARNQECRIVGDHCRARVLQLSNRQAELAVLSADHAVSERARGVDRDISAARGELARASPPGAVDRQASRLAGLVAKFIDIGHDGAERVADGLITVLAIAAEAIGLGAPRIIVTALSPVSSPGMAAPQGATNPPASAPSNSLAAQQSPPPPSPAPAPRTIPRRAARQRGSPSDWRNLFLSVRTDGKVNCWSAYTAYKGWCETKSFDPVDFQTFVAEVKIVRDATDNPNSRHSFLNVELKPRLIGAA